MISDNASNQDCQDIIYLLADRHPNLSYYLNEINGDAQLQILTAPHRARGEWTWIFGDDDLLAPGGVSRIVEILETDRPYFVTINRCVVDYDLKRLISGSKHSKPSITLPSLIELTKYIGIDQFTFLTSQLYNTDVARAIDQNAYFSLKSGFFQIPYYLEGFSGLKSFYESEAFVIHRWRPEAHLTHSINFRHLATYLPRDFAFARKRNALPPDIMEHIGGLKFANENSRQDVTSVDFVLHYLFVAITTGPIDQNEWEFLETEAVHWRHDRLCHIHRARDLYEQLVKQRQELETMEAELAEFQQKSGSAEALKRLHLATLSQGVSKAKIIHDEIIREAMSIAGHFL